LHNFIAERERRDGLKVDLRVTEVRELPARYDLALYRIIQEALNNVVKHANTDTATVTLRLGKTSILVMIEDEGVGFDPHSIRKGMTTLGLTSMRERAELLGGTFRLESQPGVGTRIVVEIAEVVEG
jgi:signal transduction histidine kinase